MSDMKMNERSPAGTVVIGVGNPLMADDGLGIVALNALCAGWKFEPSVELVDGGTWGMNLLHFVESAKRVLFIDAIHVGAEPGTHVVLEREDLPRFFSTKISTHQIDLREVLAVAELRGTLPADTVAIGLEPACIEMSDQLSPLLKKRLDFLVDLVIERLRAWGHSPRKRSHA
jgi:hydrogenase maturation protease